MTGTKISKRVKTAMERASNGIGVSTRARKQAREKWASEGNEIWSKARNDKVNDFIALGFMRAEPIHFFLLKSGEVATIRKSSDFYYIAAKRGGSYDVLVLQDNYKPVLEPIRQRRLKKYKE